MQTSAKQVDQDIIERIGNQFYKALSDIKAESQMKAFLSAFLSETEQTVMHKRFAILKMLAEGKSYTAIEAELKVSSATVSSISKLSQIPAIQELLKELAADEWATTMSTKLMDTFSFLKKKPQKETVIDPKTESNSTKAPEMAATTTESSVVSDTLTSETPQTV